MTDLDMRVDQILADPLATARAGDNPLGYVGFDLPEDLLAATGRPFAHLPWQVGAPTPRADRFLESSFEPFAKSIVEQWAEGAFDSFGEVLFSRGNDNAQRLYYYLDELQRRGEISGPKPLILDIATIQRQSSADHCVTALRRLADQLSLDEAMLAEGIAITNRRRGFFTELADERTGSGVRYERIARASLFAPLEGTDVGPVAARTGKRLLLGGSAPPDERLHRGIEASGWTIVGETYFRALDRLGAPISQQGDPVAAIAAHLHTGHASRRNFADHAASLAAAAKRARADAVVLWLIEEEESIVWHVPAQRTALAAAGIPVLALTRRRWDGEDGVAEEIGDWLREIEA
jgi:hypothetical protein